MGRRREKKAAEPLPVVVADRVQFPVCVIAGPSGDTTTLCARLGEAQVVCYEMDLHQADQLRNDLVRGGSAATVATLPDLWDLPPEFRTVLYPVGRRAERALKIDMVEQAYHVLAPGGVFIVWSDYDADQLFPGLLKKVFRKVHAPPAGRGTVLWCQRQGDHPRRRHEIVFQNRVLGREPMRFVSRPGVFAYGRFDDGARALVEAAWVEPGDRVLDVGCGCGTNGVFAWQRCGPGGHVTFIDSNVRAVELAKLNASTNGVASFDAVATFRVDGVPEGSYDVVLANPPYFAGGSIAELFVRRGAVLLKPGGRFYLVTKSPDQVGPVMVEVFGDAEVLQSRGYVVFGAWAGGPGEGSAFGPDAPRADDGS
jgi:16S rRNA (guanine1207-N2)-methyltransferase